MKLIKCMFLALTLISAMPLWAQTKIWLNGNVYSEVDSVQTMNPFATVKLYNDSGLTELAYFVVCGPFGNYSIKPYDHTRGYYIVAERSDSTARKTYLCPIPEIWDNKPFSGNATTNICIKPANPPISYESYSLTPNTLPSTASTLNEALLAIEGLNYDGDGWFAAEDRSVIFCINGNVIGKEQIKSFNKIPTNVIDKIKVYDMATNPLYGLAIDITLTVGSAAKMPEYKLQESSFFRDNHAD